MPSYLSDLYRLYQTSDATANADEILSGKTAYNATGRVEGTLTNLDLSGDGTILYWNLGRGLSGAYVPDMADAEYFAPGTSLIENTIDWLRDGNGYIMPTGSNGSRLIFDVPVKSGLCRQIIYQSMYWDLATPSNSRLPIVFNYQNPTNCWYARINYVAGTFQMDILQRSGGSITGRGNLSFSSIIDPECAATLVLEDYGDVVVFTANLTETSITGTGNNETRMLSYYAASRALKDEPNFGLGELNEANWGGVLTLHVRDIPKHL